MIRYILLFIPFCFSFSQERIVSDTIYGAENKNISLFFSNPIKKAITGSDTFFFAYDQETPSSIGILKASPGPESNLLVITDNGYIYSFIIRYQQDIKKSNYFISNSMAVGNEKGSFIKKEEKEKKDSNVISAVSVNDYEEDTANDSIANYKKNCRKEIEKEPFYNRIYGAKDNIMVKLKSISYINNDLYFTLILTNNSPLDYDINYLNFYINSKNKNRKTTSQTINYKYKFAYNVPQKLFAGKTSEAVFVYNKFSINENKILLIEMAEVNGERTVLLEIPNSFINNPK